MLVSRDWYCCCVLYSYVRLRLILFCHVRAHRLRILTAFECCFHRSARMSSRAARSPPCVFVCLRWWSPFLTLLAPIT
jgi:hypothetical protein